MENGKSEKLQRFQVSLLRWNLLRYFIGVSLSSLTWTLRTEGLLGKTIVQMSRRPASLPRRLILPSRGFGFPSQLRHDCSSRLIPRASDCYDFAVYLTFSVEEIPVQGGDEISLRTVGLHRRLENPLFITFHWEGMCG
jgi:hypothetical protein